MSKPSCNRFFIALLSSATIGLAAINGAEAHGGHSGGPGNGGVSRNGGAAFFDRHHHDTPDTQSGVNFAEHGRHHHGGGGNRVPLHGAGSSHNPIVVRSPVVSRPIAGGVGPAKPVIYKCPDCYDPNLPRGTPIRIHFSNGQSCTIQNYPGIDGCDPSNPGQRYSSYSGPLPEGGHVRDHRH